MCEKCEVMNQKFEGALAKVLDEAYPEDAPHVVNNFVAVVAAMDRNGDVFETMAIQQHQRRWQTNGLLHDVLNDIQSCQVQDRLQEP